MRLSPTLRLLTLLLALCAAAIPTLSFANLTRPQNQAPSYGLSSLQGGVQGFLERRGSGLAKASFGEQTAAQLIENIASYYNVSERSLLALIETTSGLVSAPAADPAKLARPFGAGPAGFQAQVEWASRELRAGLGPYDEPPVAELSDGQRRLIPLTDKPEEIALKRFLALERALPDWERLVAAYPAAYEGLFRDEPEAQAPTPAAHRGFLSEPWPAGTAVIHSSYFDHTYPMVDSHGDGNEMMVDYLGRSGGSYNSHDGHDYYFPDLPYGTPILAAAPGWAYARTTRGYGVVIQHTGDAAGYETVYWHLEAFPDTFKELIDGGTPRWVERGELLGWSGATGFTSGAPHLHFEVRHNGKQVDPYGWYGPGDDPCAAYSGCEASRWIWDASVSWKAPDATPVADTTPPSALVTINPDPSLRLLAQFDGLPLPAVGPAPAADGLAYAAGRFGKAALVGANDRLTFPASPTLELSSGTFALWVEVPERWSDSPTGRHYLAAASLNPVDPERIYNGTWALRHEQAGPDGAPAWSFWTVPVSGTAGHNLTAPDTLEPGWHHIAATWDAGAKALYIDGALAAQASGVSLPAEVGEDLELGRWTSGAGEVRAPLDEALSYDRPLGADEIRALALAPSAQRASAARTSQRDLTILTPALDNGGGVVQVQLGLNGRYAAPLPYYRAYRWTLPAAEGAYTLNVRLKDRSGNTTTLTSTINVDYPPQAQVKIRDVTPLGATLVLSATDANLPISVAFSSQPDPQAKIWEPLKAERAWQWAPMQPRRVYLWFRDAYGNERGPFVAGPEMWRAFLPRIAR
ncbi:MAG TPA: LamG-like jellyroll fold domain-containing protein [Herpetosiphonaceae bacterium]